MDEAKIVRCANADGMRVSTRVEDDLGIIGEGCVDDDLHAIEISKWRHRADFAIGEDLSEIVLMRQ